MYDLEAIRSSVLRSGKVEDCAALLRSQRDGRRVCVVYIVLRPGASVEDVATSSYLKDSLSSDDRLVWAAVQTIPRQVDGALDVLALERYPLIGAAELEQWISELRSSPGVLDVGIVSDADSSTARVLHIDDLLSRPCRAPHDARTDSAPTVMASSVASSDEITLSGRPAVSVGEPIAEAATQRSLVDWLRDAAAMPEPRTLTCLDARGRARAFTYAELLGTATRVAERLSVAGIEPGHRVLLRFEDAGDFLEALWGCFLLGAVPVPISASTPPGPTLMEASRVVGASVALVTRSEADALQSTSDLTVSRLLAIEVLRDSSGEPRSSTQDAEWPAPNLDAVALVVLTSGSTGMPKGVQLSSRALCAQCSGAAERLRMTSSDVSLSWMPLDHVGALILSHLRDTFVGVDQVHVVPAYVLANELRWLDLMERYSCTLSFAPNFAFSRIVRREPELAGRRYRLGAVRAIVNGGEPIVAKTARRFLELLAPHDLAPSAMVPAWGMSETCSGTTYSMRFSLETSSDEDEFVDLGSPIRGAELRIVDSRERELPEGVVGHLQMRGPNRMLGYFGNDAANAAALANDGWLRTGDLALIRDGSLWVTGREKDVVIVNGINHNCNAIEAVVERISDVEPSYTAVCAVRDGASETDSVAVFFHTAQRSDVVLRSILADIRREIARATGTQATFILPVDRQQVPKTGLGKIRRKELARRLLDGEFDALARRIQRLEAGDRTVPDWFVRKTWARADAARAADASPHGATVVFSVEADGVLEEYPESDAARAPVIRVSLTGAPRPQSPCSLSVDVRDGERLSALAATVMRERGGIGRTVLLVSGRPSVSTSGDGAAGDRGAAPHRALIAFVLGWLRALAAHSACARGHEFVLVSLLRCTGVGAQAAEAAAHATAALLRCAELEQESLRFRHIALPASADAEAARLLTREIETLPLQTDVCYCESGRFTRTFERVRFDADQEPALHRGFRRGALYVITGGLGAIGTEIAKRLLDEYDARLLLLGRSGPGSAAWTSPDASGQGTKDRRLAELRALGGSRVRYVSVDVRDAAAVAQAVHEAESHFALPLDGCLHLAGVFPQRLLEHESVDSFLETLDLQVDASRALAALMHERREAFLVLFSSVVGTLGATGLSAYAAASAYLEHFASQLRAHCGTRCTWVGWTGWLGAGWDASAQGLLEARGYHAIAATAGWRSLQVVLERDIPSVLIGLRPEHAVLNTYFRNQPLEPRRVLALCAGASSRAASTAIALPPLRDAFDTVAPADVEYVSEARLRALRAAGDADTDAPGSQRADPVPPRGSLEASIERIWCEVMARDRIGVTASFFEVGGTSLQATQIASRIEDEFGVRIPVTSLLGQPTIEAAALAVLERQIAQIAPAHAGRLVADVEAACHE